MVLCELSVNGELHAWFAAPVLMFLMDILIAREHFEDRLGSHCELLRLVFGLDWGILDRQMLVLRVLLCFHVRTMSWADTYALCFVRSLLKDTSGLRRVIAAH